ncbi:MAG: GNAT family N-acetyltransferase [Paracoccaceae bacterium]|nr:GNAT family N-acetyltransferase [Paracoccaceae bacterium]MDG1739650.1 GNAT family N-acetyltransferase [Paracoccaceae bacterium]MDG2257195.1 GNAT family N-acetyltransferase [Paracoccaceae bacterium]
MTDIKLLTADAVMPLIKLDVSDDQRDFVASNAVTMAQSLFEPGNEIYGIWEGETPVGLMALVDMSFSGADLDEGDDPDGLYVWRLMIAKDKQGNGHGRDAMQFAEKRCRELGRKQLLLSAVEAENGAIPFYEKQGYRKTGRIVSGETELVKVLRNP